jgi:succinate dehydrogenase / fumarate reductase, cytochrome b subunit
MILTGLTILAFVIYHMLHFTVRVGNEYNNPELYKFMLDGKEVHNAWKMVIDGFQLVAGHALLRHRHDAALPRTSCTASSIFQTLGFRSKKSASLIQQISIGYALFIWLGFISIPIAISCSASDAERFKSIQSPIFNLQSSRHVHRPRQQDPVRPA